MADMQMAARAVRVYLRRKWYGIGQPLDIKDLSAIQPSTQGYCRRCANRLGECWVEKVNTGFRILLVESDVLVALDLAEELQADGFAIARIADTLKYAEEAVEDADFDIAILNVGLGDCAAYPVARRLREQGVPFAFFTAFEDTEIQPEFRNVPRIPKPQSARDFASLVRNWTSTISTPSRSDAASEVAGKPQSSLEMRVR
jgi:CheY-like chemotaxis protein